MPRARQNLHDWLLDFPVINKVSISRPHEVPLGPSDSMCRKRTCGRGHASAASEDPKP